MGLAAEKLNMDAQAYLAFERAAEERHEFVDGDIFAMSGASRKHNLINGNIFANLHAKLKKSPCEIYNNDMRVNISPTGDYVYPDIVLVCSQPEFADAHLDTLLNPLLIIEVLSPSTEAYDRGKKCVHYRHINSLQTYVLVAQDAPHIECYRRSEANEWVLSEARGLESLLFLGSIGCQLALADVYDKVSWETEDDL